MEGGKVMKKFNSLRDVEWYISEQRIDPSQYEEDYIDGVAINYVRFLRQNFGWRYGEEVPEITEDEFWSLFSDYEKEVD